MSDETLRAQNASYALDIRMLHEQANSQSVMLRIMTGQRDEAHKEAATLREQVATLTAERDHLRKNNAALLKDAWDANDRETAHLAAIETLRAAVDSSLFAMHVDDNNTQMGQAARRVCIEALEKTADYAKKADEVES